MKSINFLFVLMLIGLITVMQSCKDPEVERKIDGHLKLQIQNLKDTSQLDKTISIVFKANEQLTERHRESLQDKGIKIVANIGSIYTAQLPAKSLYDLAKLKFVESIQGAREVKIHPVDSLKLIPN